MLNAQPYNNMHINSTRDRVSERDINIMSWEAASTVKLTTKLLTIWSNFVVGVNE